jgi:hypothetical protein
MAMGQQQRSINQLWDVPVLYTTTLVMGMVPCEFCELCDLLRKILNFM